MKQASIVILTYAGDYEKLQTTLAGLVGDFEIIVVDNSERPLYQYPPVDMKYLHGFRYVLDGFVKQLTIATDMARELGVQYATSSLIIFIEPGLVLPKGWFPLLQLFLKKPDDYLGGKLMENLWVSVDGNRVELWTYKD